MTEKTKVEPVEDAIESDNQISALQKELAAAKESAEANLVKLKYLMADFDNYRKQMEKQATMKIESAKGDLLLKFLNIRDDYQRAVEMARQKNSDPMVVEGLEGILKNMDSFLSSEGVQHIKTVGLPFDPNLHDAIAYSSKDDVPDNHVTAEIRRGYTLNNKVLRPSMVEISRKIITNTDSSNQ